MAAVKTPGPEEKTQTRRLGTLRPGGCVERTAGPTSPQDLAAERLTDYFRSLGLRDDRVLEEAIAGVIRSMEKRPSGEGTEAYVHDAMEAAIRSFEQWLDDLVAWTRDQGADPVVRGCIAWRLRILLADHPDVFLKKEGLPQGFREALLDAAVPVLPEPNPFPMAPQNIGRNWSLGFRSFWGRILGHGHSTSGARDRGRKGGES